MEGIKFVALVRYDFCAATDEAEVLDELEQRYGSEPHQHGWQTFGGGSGSHKVFGDEPDIEGGEEEFRYVRTSVEQRVEHIIDVTSVAVLSTAQLENIERWDERRASPYLGELHERLEGISARLPTVVESSQNSNPAIVYVEPEERIDVRYDEDGELIPESIYEEGMSRELLSKFQIYLHEAATDWGEDIVNARATMQRWGSLSVFNLSATCDDIDKEWTTEPLWLRRLSRLVPYLRAFHWLNFRLNQIREYDHDTHGVSDLVSEDSDEEAVQTLIEKQETLGERREQWTDLSTKTRDELEVLQRDFGPHGIDSVEPADIPTLAPDSEGAVRFAGDPDPLDHYYKQTVELLFQRTDDTIRRVSEKQEQISNLIHDQIQVKAEKSNLDLQESIRTLTWVLMGLTVILVIIEIAPVVAGLLP